MRLWHAFTYPEDPSIDERIRAAAAGVVAAGIADECPVVKRSGATFDAHQHEWSGLIMWGQNFIRAVRHMEGTGRPVICLERGHFADRMEQTRIARGGIFGRALRWPKTFGKVAVPPTREPNGSLLVVGEVHGNAASHGVDIPRHMEAVIGLGRQMGYRVTYRPHPSQLRIEALKGVSGVVRGAAPSGGTLEDDLAACATVYTVTSGVAVTAALAGCRVVASHDNSPMWKAVPRELAPVVGAPNIASAARLGQLRACEFSVAELASGVPLAAVMAKR